MGQMYFEHDSRGSHPSTIQRWQHSPAGSVGRWHGAPANHFDYSVFSIMSVLTSDNHRLGIIVGSDDTPHNTEIGIDYGASFGSMSMTFSMPGKPPKMRVSGTATMHDLQETTVEPQQTAQHGYSTRTPHSTPGKQMSSSIAVLKWFRNLSPNMPSHRQLLQMHATRFVLVLTAIILIIHAVLISTIHNTYRVPSRSITFLEWVGTQNKTAAHASATADLRMDARFERVEHDLTIRLVEGTSSAADKLLVPALVARDTILGPVTTWCPWWWRSASYIPELRTHIPQPQPARWAPRTSRSTVT